MLRTKPTILKKLTLILVAVVAITVLGSASTYAATPTPTPPTGCSGNNKTCVCPTSNPNCGQDPVIKTFEQCAKKYDKNSTAYKNCVEDNNIFKKYLNPFIAFLSFLVGLAVVVGIIVGGIQYVISGGDPQAAANGKRHIRNAIIAFVVYLFLFALINFLVPGGIF